MSRVTQVIDDARRILADISADRYTDADLISLYNQGVLDIVIKSKLLKGKAFVEIESNINTYNMPDEVLKINRVQYLDTNIDVVSHDQMDDIDALWETRTGSKLTHAITNLTDAGTFKIYPRITDTTMDYVTANSPYGIIIDLETFDDIYNLPGIEDLSTIPKYMVVYYTKLPDTVAIDTLDTALQLSKAWDNALIHFIAGSSLRNDGDAQNRQFGAEELQIYSSNLDIIVNEETINHTGNASITTQYVAGV